MTDDQRIVAALLHFEERGAFRPLLVDLVAFADNEHEYRDGGCHPQPGVDCYDWCEACKLLARVPADVLGEARQQLRERGLDRD
ncbi:hypothetical protein [Dactylosporangium sp. CA-139066]|uniref:hypothetical protein n=1 Tax=Dactylosporangium sp. CA-139066 TaxID=3239930 RepID=UPI003D8C0C76